MSRVTKAQVNSSIQPPINVNAFLAIIKYQLSLNHAFHVVEVYVLNVLVQVLLVVSLVSLVLNYLLFKHAVVLMVLFRQMESVQHVTIVVPLVQSPINVVLVQTQIGIFLTVVTVKIVTMIMDNQFVKLVLIIVQLVQVALYVLHVTQLPIKYFQTIYVSVCSAFIHHSILLQEQLHVCLVIQFVTLAQVLPKTVLLATQRNIKFQQLIVTDKELVYVPVDISWIVMDLVFKLTA